MSDQASPVAALGARVSGTDTTAFAGAEIQSAQKTVEAKENRENTKDNRLPPRRARAPRLSLLLRRPATFRKVLPLELR